MIQLSNGALTFVVDGVAYSAPVYMAHGSETALVANIRQAVAAAIVSGNPPEVVGASAGKAAFDPA